MNKSINRIHLRWPSYSLVLAVLAVIGLGLAQPVRAAEFRSGNTVVIGEDQVIDDDLFVSAQTVIVNGKVTGNLLVAGTDLTVNGTVGGSLFMTGQSLAANGTVDGSLYAAGSTFTLGPTAKVGRNLYGGGFSLTTAPGSQIGRSFYGSGYQVILNGAVANDVNIGSTALELNGSVGGDVRGTVSNANTAALPSFLPAFAGNVPTVPPGMHVSNNAQVKGQVAVESATTTPAATAPFYSLANSRTRWIIGEFITLLLIGSLLLWLRPTWLRRTSTAAQRWLPSLGNGLLTLIVSIILIPLALALIILLAIAGGWLTFGQLATAILGVGLTTWVLAIVLLFFAIGILSKIVAAYLGGQLLLQRQLTTTRTGSDFIALALGLLVYSLLRSIPFGIGWVIGAIVVLLGLGAIVISLRRTPHPRAIMVPTSARPGREIPV